MDTEVRSPATQSAQERRLLCYVEFNQKVKTLFGQKTFSTSTLPRWDPTDRNPYIASFEKDGFKFILVSVHIFFGSDDDSDDMERRQLETYAVGRWADLRRNSSNAYTKNIIGLGDFNLPKAIAGDPVYTALTDRGLQVPEHLSQIWSNIKDDANYDQIAFFPGMKRRLSGSGVFDFDGAVFRDMFEQRTKKQFLSYLRYYISDHRIMWAQFTTS